MRMFCAGTVAIALLIAVDASAAVYMWEDDQGVTGFTEDFGAIPQKYRKKAKILGQEQTEESGTIVLDEIQGTKTVKPPVLDTGAPAGSAPPANAQKKLYGGKDDAYWINEFGKLNANLSSCKDQLDAINSRLSDTSKMTRSDYKSLDLSRKLLEDQESSARKKLESLQKEADKAGVPQNLR